MRAVTYQGKHKVEVTEEPIPKLEDSSDAIIRVTSTAICGSDLHLYDRALVGMKRGDILGHEFMGVVVERGDDVTHVEEEQRVVVPFVIACGECFYCSRGEYSLCDTTNPNAGLVEKLYGQSPAGLFGYTHLFGGFAGGQAEYVRVPHADVGLFAVPEDLVDDDVLFLTDILPTGWMAAENCGIAEGDVVLVAGAGPVGQLAAECALVMGAREVAIVDRVPSRLERAAELPGIVPLEEGSADLERELARLTRGRGPDAAIDAVGLEAHGGGVPGVYDRVKQRFRLQTDRTTALRTAMKAVRKGGRVSVPGVYGGVADKFPIGLLFGKGLTMTGGQTHVHRYIPQLLELIREGQINPARIIEAHMPLEDAPEAYRRFHAQELLKVVLQPQPSAPPRPRTRAGQEEAQP
jgi:threonine dehydrogenase-like Zn-dependent dehydrogenase